jgi:hypothetical protein
MSNPLIAQANHDTTGYAGIGILEGYRKPFSVSLLTGVSVPQ